MIIEKFITYDYSKIADWLIKTGVVLLAAALIVILGLIWLKVTAKNQIADLVTGYPWLKIIMMPGYMLIEK